MKKYSIIILIIGLTLSSCSDFLEVEPKSTKSVVPTSLEDAQAAVDGIYIYLGSPYGMYGYASMPFSILEVTTGALKPALGTQDTGMEQAYDLILSDGAQDLSRLWIFHYTGIEQANIAITYIPDIEDPDMTDELKTNLLAEAHCLRAYYYFQLVQIFGDIPLKKTPTLSLEDGQISKSTVQEVYEEVIVPDLEFAMNSTLQERSDIGRISKGIVRALFAKVYLTMAGNPLNQTDKYALASEVGLELINEGGYSLFQSDPEGLTWMDKLSEPAYDLEGENMLMAQYDGDLVLSNISTYFSPLGTTPFTVTFLTQTFGGMEPEDSFLASYDASDVRGQNQGFFFNEIDGYTFNWSVYKYFFEGFRTNGRGLTDKNVSLIRYADALLTFAEAQNETSTGANAEAYTALNAIRSRAGLAEVSGLSKEDFREEVWKQRVWEFPAENGLIWFDMKRTLKAFNGTGFNNFVGHTLPNGKVLTADHIYWPVPADEKTLNPNL